MHYYAHQLIANCVSLLFGARQVVYHGFLELLPWKKLSVTTEDNAIIAVRMNQHIKFMERIAKQLAETRYEAHGWAADKGE